MKYLFTYLITIISLLTYGQNGHITHRNDLNLQGQVLRLEVNQQALGMTQYYTFTSPGYCTELRAEFLNGSSATTYYNYDLENNLLSKDELSGEYEASYAYTMINDSTFQENNLDTSVFFDIYTYASNGNILKQESFENSDYLWRKIKYTYNKDNQLLESKTYEDDWLIEISSYGYDEDLLTTITQTNTDTETTIHYFYEYADFDEQGNWQTRRTYITKPGEEKTLADLTTRKISYE